MNFVNDITKGLLSEIASGIGNEFKGALNIRENGSCAERRSTEHIRITEKKDKPGIDIRVLPGTKGETVFIPACVTSDGVADLVYNDFYIGEGADVLVVAGCGIHSEGENEARHDGIHRFFLEKGVKSRFTPVTQKLGNFRHRKLSAG